MPTADIPRGTPPCLMKIWEQCNGSTWQIGDTKGELCDCARALVDRLRERHQQQPPTP